MKSGTMIAANPVLLTESVAEHGIGKHPCSIETRLSFLSILHSSTVISLTIAHHKRTSPPSGNACIHACRVAGLQPHNRAIQYRLARLWPQPATTGFSVVIAKAFRSGDATRPKEPKEDTQNLHTVRTSMSFRLPSIRLSLMTS